MPDSDTSTSSFFTNLDNTAKPGDDHFTDLQELPSGGFNVLVRAKRNGQWWMLKGLKPEYRNDNAYQRLLRKELNITHDLDHSSVVTAKEIVEVEGLGPCIVMEYVDGVTLKQWLTEKHSKAERRHIVQQLTDVLEYIHNRQVVHRDLKPSNIMITRNGQKVKLIDFGLADSDSYAEFKQSAGTMGFIAPEQATGGHPDQRNDIYSLGCIIELMGLGWRYRRVARICQSPIGRRPKDIAAVRGQLAFFHSLQLVAFLLLMAIAVCGAGIYAYGIYTEPSKQFDVVARFETGDIRYESWGNGQVSARCINSMAQCGEIPAEAKYKGMTYKVNEITFNAFNECKAMRTVILPNVADMHVMRSAFDAAVSLRTIVFRCPTPPIIGNKFWPCKITDIFTDKQFLIVKLVVPKGALQAYKDSPWGRFSHIEEAKE